MSTLHTQDLFNLGVTCRVLAEHCKRGEFDQDELIETLLMCADEFAFTSVLEERYAHKCPDYYQDAYKHVKHMLKDTRKKDEYVRD